MFILSNVKNRNNNYYSMVNFVLNERSLYFVGNGLFTSDFVN